MEWEDYKKELWNLFEAEMVTCLNANDYDKWHEARSKLIAYNNVINIPIKAIAGEDQRQAEISKRQSILKIIYRKLVNKIKIDK